MREYNCVGRGLIVPETDESPEMKKGRVFLLPTLLEWVKVKNASCTSIT